MIIVVMMFRNHKLCVVFKNVYLHPLLLRYVIYLFLFSLAQSFQDLIKVQCILMYDFYCITFSSVSAVIMVPHLYIVVKCI